ncbi:MAG: GNAT family N-acetyltransferase [Anaerolineae bacterium]|jgi:GNAT superfamily N-acetyltransferase|nr:GNAT family N-acetyltransferase [Anaerolineae bacterium]
MRVRLATLGDLSAIAKIHVDSWRTTYRGMMPDAVLDNLSEERSLKRWTERLAQSPADGSWIYVVEDDRDQVVGFVHGGIPIEPIEGYESQLYAIYLFQSAQGSGLGRALFSAFVDQLIVAGYRSMALWVLRENHPARRFYERMGGVTLDEKNFVMYETELIEVGYGWTNLTRIRPSTLNFTG